jgi:hypothetical protein
MHTGKKRALCLVFGLALGFAFTGCQTAPQGKPLTEMTEVEQIAYNQHAPMEEPREPGTDLGDVMKTVGTVIVFIPVLIWESLAWGGAQISTGK